MSTITPDTNVRLSYANLIEPRAQDEDQPDVKTFSTAILIPKSDTATVEAIRAAIDEARKDGVAKLWKGKTPDGLRNPLRDGDTKVDKEGNPDLLYADHWFLNAKGGKGGKDRPILLDKNSEETLSESDVYSGVFGRVSLQFYPYDTKGNRGVACGINAFMSAGYGESLGNVVTADGARAAFGVSTPASAARSEFNGGGSGSDDSDDSAQGDPWGKSE